MSLIFLSFGLICLISIFSSASSQQPANADECLDCCTEFFENDGPGQVDNGVTNGFLLDACVEECGNQDGIENCGQDNGLIDDACRLGFGFITEGTGIFILEGDIEPTQFFCVRGSLDESFAPTVSPTPPTESPTVLTASPTETPPSEDDSLVIVIGAGAGTAVLVLVVIVLLYPSAEKRRRRRLKQGLSEDGSEDRGKAVAISGALGRPMLPNMNDAAASVTGQTIAETVAGLKELDVAANAPVRATFVVEQTFISEHRDELGAERGEILLGLTPVDESWWIVKRENTAEVGLFPITFLKELFKAEEALPEFDGSTKPVDPDDIF